MNYHTIKKKLAKEVNHNDLFFNPIYNFIYIPEIYLIYLFFNNLGKKEKENKVCASVKWIFFPPYCMNRAAAGDLILISVISQLHKL